MDEGNHTDGTAGEPEGDGLPDGAAEGTSEPGMGATVGEGAADGGSELGPPDNPAGAEVTETPLDAADDVRRKWLIGGGIAAAAVVAILAVLAFTGSGAEAQEPELSLRSYRIVGVAATPASTTTTTPTTTTVPATTTTMADTTTTVAETTTTVEGTTTVPDTTTSTEAGTTDTTVAATTTTVAATTTTSPETTTTAAETTTTVAATTTPEAPPATEPPAGPQPADSEEVALIDAFVVDFNAALDDEDTDFLLATLSPISIDVFGDEACADRVQNHVSRVRDVTLDSTILGPADYTVAIPDVEGAYEITVESIYTSNASYTIDGEPSGQEAWLQIDEGGRVSYIINCGGDKVEVN